MKGQRTKDTLEQLFLDETVSDLVKEATVNLLQLNPVEVSTQLMVEDFTIFRQIEATEYVDDLFDIKSRLDLHSNSNLYIRITLILWTPMTTFQIRNS